MLSQDTLSGFTVSLSQVRNLTDKLNERVVEQVNDTQELVMISTFMKESNEYQFKKCLEERISDVASWRWVLDDLVNRLVDSTEAFKHEIDAIHVVLQRIDEEINAATSYVAKPSILLPVSDPVEEAIIQELVFLREEKKRFNSIIPQISKQKIVLEKMKTRIEHDVLNKNQAMSVDQACYHNDCTFVNCEKNKTREKKRCLSLTQWEKRCCSLKKAGINALRNAIITRQKIRAARVQLSITAQAYGTRIDSALRRRLHSNIIKLQDLNWQREEAINDLKSLENEVTTTEKSLLDTMDRQKKVGVRLADRSLRPDGEHTTDGVSHQLRFELGRLRKLSKDLRNNIENITSLQINLEGVIAHIDCCAEDIMQVVKLDQERLRGRLVEDTATTEGAINTVSLPQQYQQFQRQMDRPLEAIREEDEND